MVDLGPGNPIFGPDWVGTPRAERAVFIPTPLNEHCFICREEIVDGDSGEVMGCAGEKEARVVVCHRECFLSQVIGHEYGYCSCNDYRGLSIRDAARAIVKAMKEK